MILYLQYKSNRYIDRKDDAQLLYSPFSAYLLQRQLENLADKEKLEAKVIRQFVMEVNS